jgi:protein phosphatase PTC7
LKQVLVDSVKDNRYKGSTTCVLAKFDTSRENVIKTTNLGDSGYLILRPSTAKDGELVLMFRSKEQQREFNFPYQCGSAHKNEEYEAIDNEHEVQDRDILVMFSDGVADNVETEDIIETVRSFTKDRIIDNVRACSQALGALAYKHSKRKNFKSPFA